MIYGSLLKIAQAVKARPGRHLIGMLLAALALMGFGRPALARSLALVTSLEPNTSLSVTCPTYFTVKLSKDKKTVTLKCAPLPAPTASPLPSATVLPGSGPTTVPTSTPTSLPTLPPTATATATPFSITPPTATPSTLPPTATSAPSSVVLPAVDPLILGTCPAAVHDRYTVVGPDGKTYRTWHPVTVPLDLNDPSKGTCTFAHEHGDDPRTSLANPSLPPFGYVGTLAGDNEPHEGFKVFVANQGVVNDEGRDAKTSTRIVAHMGTGGPKRFDTRLHSLIFDLVAPDGHYVHVQGMASTGLVGSICDRDKTLSDNDPTNDIGRTVLITKGSGCDVPSTYEIWLFQLNIGDKATIIASTAVLDPITLMNPVDHTLLIYTSTNYPGEYHGCNREAYFGPVYWYNANGPTVYYTNAYGNIVSGGELRQEISAHSAIGIPMSPDQTQFKLHVSQCVPGLGLKN